MSVAAHAAGGADPSAAASVGVIVTATALSAAGLARRRGTGGYRVAPLAAIVLLNQLAGHLLLHAGHMVSMTSGDARGHAGHAMTADPMNHHGHGVSDAHPVMPPSGAGPDLSMFVPTPSMLAAHIVGAIVAGLMLAAAFALADRVAAARHRALSRPRSARVVVAVLRRDLASVGVPLAGHLRLDRSRGPPPAVI
jgi:hypothetical protein